MATCSWCEGDTFFNGMELQSNPPQYAHTCEDCGKATYLLEKSEAPKPEPMAKDAEVDTVLHLHSDRDFLREFAREEEIHLTDEALGVFVRALYEVRFDVVVKGDGTVMIHGVNGIALTTPVKG